MSEFDTLLVGVHELRKELDVSDDFTRLTDEEFLIVSLAHANRQDLINQCRWVVIEKLMKEGYLIELDGFNIRSCFEDQGEKRGSTNRI